MKKKIVSVMFVVILCGCGNAAESSAPDASTEGSACGAHVRACKPHEALVGADCDPPADPTVESPVCCFLTLTGQGWVLAQACEP